MASADQPVVLVLDDLQWADNASLALLRHLAAADRSLRVLLLGTYRDTELSRSHPLLDALAALRRQDGVSRIELAGLDDTEVVSFLVAAAGHALDDAAVGLAHAVYRETDGNPFFVTEVLRHLVETGAISRDNTGRWVADDSLEQMALPASVREVIGARVGRLGYDAEQALSMAAVIGRDFDLDLLARATKTSEDELIDVLDAAAAVALVREVADTGRYCFAHALIQHTLYEDLGHNRRARAHRRVAESLEDLCGDRLGHRVGELARHWISATQPIDLAKAINYSRLAGDAALSALAPADALGYYAQALDLYARADEPDPILGLDLRIGLGTAQRQTGDAAFRETLLEVAHQAADVGDTERLVAAALANDRGFPSATGVIDAERVAILETALTRVPTEHPDRALLLAALCSEVNLGSTLQRRQALADEALAIAMASGDDTTIVRVNNNVFIPLLAPHLLDQTLARTADALARAVRVGDPVLLNFAATWRALAAFRAGDIDEVDRCLEIAGAVAEQLDQPILNWSVLLNVVARALLVGDTDKAEHLARDAFRIGTDSGQPDATLYFGIHYMIVSWQRGTLGDLAPLIEREAANTPGIAGAIAAALARAHAEGDRTDDARHLLETFAATEFELPIDSSWVSSMACYSEAAIECRERSCAGRLLDSLTPYADQWCTTGSTSEGPVSHYLGGLATVLGRYDDADVYFTQAAAFNDRIGAKFYGARTYLSWGRMLAEHRAPGDAQKARDLLTKALTVAAAHGYANVERRAAQALQHLD